MLFTNTTCTLPAGTGDPPAVTVPLIVPITVAADTECAEAIVTRLAATRLNTDKRFQTDVRMMAPHIHVGHLMTIVTIYVMFVVK